MTDYTPRQLANNYIRNGGVETGTLKHWTVPTGYLSYAITLDTNFGSGKCLEGSTLSGTVTHHHNDYIKVREGEHIDLVAVLDSSIPLTYVATLNCYNGSLKHLQSLSENIVTAGTGYEIVEFNYRIPKNVSYIKLQNVYTIAAGNTFKVGDFSVQIQNSKDAITKTTNLIELNPISNTPIPVSGSEDYTIQLHTTKLKCLYTKAYRCDIRLLWNTDIFRQCSV